MGSRGFCLRTPSARHPWLATFRGLGNTALHWAAWYGHDSTVALLLQHGADVTAKDRDGLGPRAKRVSPKTAWLSLCCEDVKRSEISSRTSCSASAGKAPMSRGKEPVDVATTNKIKALLRKAEEVRN